MGEKLDRRELTASVLAGAVGGAGATGITAMASRWWGKTHDLELHIDESNSNDSTTDRLIFSYTIEVRNIGDYVENNFTLYVTLVVGGQDSILGYYSSAHASQSVSDQDINSNVDREFDVTAIPDQWIKVERLHVGGEISLLLLTNLPVTWLEAAASSDDAYVESRWVWEVES